MTTAPALGALLEIREAWRVHGSGPSAITALAGVNCEIQPGELVAVMGPSGSGKSTLLNLAGGLDVPTNGSVLIGGRLTSGLRAGALARLRRRTLGFVFQELNLIPSLTVAENVALPRELDGLSVSVAREEARRALAQVGLVDRADAFPAGLSGGEQQRVAIARALVGDRRLILADEPTGALDTGTGDDVLGIIRDRCDAGAAALVVTHNARHAAWADRVLFLRDGREVTRSVFQSSPTRSRHGTPAGPGGVADIPGYAWRWGPPERGGVGASHALGATGAEHAVDAPTPVDHTEPAAAP